MDDVVITVAPSACGWTVTAEGLEPTSYSSGGQAEAAARALAAAFLHLRHRVKLRVFDRGGRLVEGGARARPRLALA